MTNRSQSIKSLHIDDRPREKMILKGKEALSNAELIAILLGSGTKELNAIQLAQHLLHENNQSINNLARLSIKELQQYPGIGPAKAVTISAALELGRRRKLEEANQDDLIADSRSAYNYLAPHLSDLNVEEFWVIYLNQKNKCIGKQRISTGGITSTVVDKRVILKEALLLNAVSIILGHNHPSGNTKPSKPDLKLTKEIKDAAQLMGISILDHIIVTNNSYTSFADEGLL